MNREARESLTEALETLSRVQYRTRSAPPSELTQDVETLAACIRSAAPDKQTAADWLRGIAWLVEHHAPEALGAELRRVSRSS